MSAAESGIPEPAGTHGHRHDDTERHQTRERPETRERHETHPHGAVDCSQVVLRVFAYIDHETAAEDTARIKAHLDGCAHCLDEYERDVLLKAMVRRSCAAQAAPGALRSRILARLTSVTVETPASGDFSGSRETIAAIEVIDEAVDRWDAPRG